ncbi:hypothetical protein CCU68_34295 [Pseudomonas gingeri NCPPB 3146 = LMG 5327]|uniref:Uncharacterized protein n=2 Tax=Pseudomonas gingeri TaxID=117681 RepID=A0A7Y7Y242_9PSED|nr:hypothetical protein [Pseudomonas gingeri]NWC16562.1 hypothetical protein [Pseudomonas gingeri]PNQ87904.1 hypothetical protein CCU68_34295 [Pseudomonas gingeri NCPPB 3146 = LMG 5327]
MSVRDRHAIAYDLRDYRLPTRLHDAATGVLQALSQAKTFAQVQQRLADGLAVLDQLIGDPDVQVLDVEFVRGILATRADWQHGQVFPR